MIIMNDNNIIGNDDDDDDDDKLGIYCYCYLQKNKNNTTRLLFDVHISGEPPRISALQKLVHGHDGLHFCR